jgi:hypothetical protein
LDEWRVEAVEEAVISALDDPRLVGKDVLNQHLWLKSIRYKKHDQSVMISPAELEGWCRYQ